MKKTISSLLLVFSFLNTPAVFSHPGGHVIEEQAVVQHGGGCRKSSPPGMCCHMNRKTGYVHCH